MSDFLVIRHSLRSDPKVLRLAQLCEAEVDLVMGKLISLWSYVDQHTDDGLIEYAGAERVDAIVGLRGLASALCQVGWLELNLTGAQVLGYEQYLGVEGIRKLFESWLAAHPKGKGRRSLPNDPDFMDFWAEYPSKTARKKALEKWHAIAPDESLRRQIMHALRLDKKSHQWMKEGGAYVPHASTWLNQERWKDERPASTGIVPGRVSAPAGKYARLSGVQGAEDAADAKAGVSPHQGADAGVDASLFPPDDP